MMIGVASERIRFIRKFTKYKRDFDFLGKGNGN